MWSKLATIAKAVAGGLTSGATYLIGVIPPETQIGEIHTALSANQYLALVLAMLAGGGLVWTVPNRSPGAHEAT